MKKVTMLVAVAVLIAMVSGCSHMSATQQRTLSGGAIGAGTGAVISVLAGGHVLVGTAIGAAAGAVGGLIYDDAQKKK
jgi:osmotically inducible lipoprotein OsmB